MYEFHFINIETGNSDFAYGYDLQDAKRRSPRFNDPVWELYHSEYID